MAYLMTEEQLRQTFKTFSNSSTGKITRSSLLKWCKKHHVSTSHVDEFIKKPKATTVTNHVFRRAVMTSCIFKQFDEDEDHEVDFWEFVRYYMREEIERNFREFDTNGDGTITRQELFDVIGSMRLSEQEVLKHVMDLAKSVDENSDGNISYTEFAKHFVASTYSAE